ncbi:L-threo-3-hydroxyaspartate ammonia-lyase [Rhodovastum atsumiense]|uniref:Threonine/serine dehydratase n=1 Tax=Rhodovastum atsumiense TaxID=504468 RepID=A0A5M6IKK4_9PROT|nr:threonine/serine dehydratase [Rhodovastum atsumiense]KAA5608712.1 threonine/serine dehydratase [Rhodovastum atsumiense]CAH2604977.1 L-threo-3-hydroxyaspartate ammonia-lyase [Rhodovastum atsumiense]
MRLPGFEDVAAARARLAPHVVRTPLLRHPLLDERTGGTILLKPEPLQRTGSFKLRGATNAILQLSDAQRRAGVVTHSSGNHGQATACAAAALGSHATVFMPADAPRIKVESTRHWGAEIVPYDRLNDDREALARTHAERTGATLVPPFDHPDVIAGQGTLALELVEDAAACGLAMDALLVCTGGGGLIAGCALAIEGASPGTRVYAVEPADWDDTARSLVAGERRQNAPGGSTLCDALLSKTPGRITFEVNRPRLSGGLAVTDSEVLAAIAFAFSHLKLVVEPGGAVALAALLAGHFDARGKVVGAVISGGNVDPQVFGRALNG